MRLGSLLGLCVAFATVSPALADTRVFLVANQPDEYGIDHCLAAGDHCGALAARSYCRSHEFTQAASFHLVAPAEITGSVPAADDVTMVRGVSYVAITCQR